MSFMEKDGKIDHLYAGLQSRIGPLQLGVVLVSFSFDNKEMANLKIGK